MFQRKPLREDLHKEILARIGDGRLPAGHRINESRLSSALGISRTPLREAMLGLEAQGFLGSDMGRGFLVPELNVQEFAEIQYVLTDLKPLALSLSFPLPLGRVMELHNQLGRARLKTAQAGSRPPDGPGRHGPPLFPPDSGNLLQPICWPRTSPGWTVWPAATGTKRSSWVSIPTNISQSHDELYELLRKDQREEAVHHWRGHIERFSAEAARICPIRPWKSDNLGVRLTPAQF